ncbi:MAG: sulfite exporter TauE/SafE family protein [Armatimonadetes bacterium]|nr:sulfite exporter TauE/SafE family protein [Armatimonadota bacterium]
MTFSLTHLFLFAAALLAGAINSVAGGGTLLTFPALLAAPHVSYVMANATSTVALVPGSVSAFWGYRQEMGRGRRELLWLGLPSLAGGVIGAKLVLRAGDEVFAHLVPWLILGATALFMLNEPVRRWVARGRREEAAPSARQGVLGVMLFQFVVAVYGGFFGAGMGILMLAALGFLGLSNIHHMNGLKNFAAVCINGVAAATFILGGRVNWPLALLMAVGAVLGGYGGAGLARRLGQKNVRRLVVGIGLVIGLAMLVKQLRLL